MREQHTMPKDIAATLKNAGLRTDYKARPAYQRNDYIGWINRAKTPAMRIERLEQMLTELAQGGIYMSDAVRAATGGLGAVALHGRRLEGPPPPDRCRSRTCAAA